jgi:hypothetical protein
MCCVSSIHVRLDDNDLGTVGNAGIKANAGIENNAGILQ